MNEYIYSSTELKYNLTHLYFYVTLYFLLRLRGKYCNFLFLCCIYSDDFSYLLYYRLHDVRAEVIDL